MRAGYSAKNADKIGPELLGKTRVVEAISAAQKARSEATGTTAAWVLEELKKVYEASMEARPLYDSKGNEKGFSFNPAAANRSLELLGKHIGMFKDNKPAVSVNVNLPGDESDFADRLRARRKLRSDGKLLQLVPSADDNDAN